MNQLAVNPQEWIKALRNKKYIKAIYNEITNNVDIYYSICNKKTDILKESLNQNDLNLRVSRGGEAWYYPDRTDDVLILINKFGTVHVYKINSGNKLKYLVVDIANDIIKKYDDTVKTSIFSGDQAFEAYEYLKNQTFFDVYFVVNFNPI